MHSFSGFDFMPWFGWIAIVAIVSGAVQAIVKSMITHRERMAMIGQGMYPDAEVREIQAPEKTRLHEL